MLTKAQIEKLTTLTTNQKYGKILEHAIEAWKNIGVRFGDFGLDFDNKNFLIQQKIILVVY